MASTLRIASFNVSMESRNYFHQAVHATAAAGRQRGADILMAALATGHHRQIKNIAEIIQRVRPQVILLNEFDYIEDVTRGVGAFQQRYLSQSQNGCPAIHYAHRFLAPVNTGELTPHDLNGDGVITLPEDAHGFGDYPGHYGMVLLSQYPIDHDRLRTFQTFKWCDMPGALQPTFPCGKPYYSPQAWASLRLSSKSHWDIPVDIDGERVHFLASHPTPPVFDGEEDRNGKRNHDEIRFWRDYIDADSHRAHYIYDDAGRRGGLDPAARFVILGDLNASPVEGDGIRAGIDRLLNHPRVRQFAAPQSEGGRHNIPASAFAGEHTMQWGLRVDYVLPSAAGFVVRDCGVYWPPPDAEASRLVRARETGSDHRLVWVDVNIVDD